MEECIFSEKVIVVCPTGIAAGEVFAVQQERSLFTFETINTWPLSTWTFQPDPRYLRNLNVWKPRDAPLYIWILPAGVFVRELIKNAREEFIESIYGVTDTPKSPAAINKIDVWILELRSYAKSCPCINSQWRKASELMLWWSTELQTSSIEKPSQSLDEITEWRHWPQFELHWRRSMSLNISKWRHD